MSSQRDLTFKKLCADIGVDLTQQLRAVPRYELAVEHDGLLYVSGQIPRLRGAVAVAGRVGAEVSFEEARRAARISVLRALAIVRQHAGSMLRVSQMLRMTVHIQSAPNFTEHSEVADAASDVLYELFGEAAGGHTRTTTGVYQLPKNAALEIDLLLALGEREEGASTF
ncbi:MAG TPA: RidA family protein [Methylibium sp.]|uniref:RidA family protein n=1 Tax=Methylibium sp. TaxID=2067992 RepID=UPI002DBD1C75|nr:RidA family protein [Methylibium sp.]HEU4460645.1 RidA family protein [Methylibium sp.]